MSNGSPALACGVLWPIANQWIDIGHRGCDRLISRKNESEEETNSHPHWEGHLQTAKGLIPVGMSPLLPSEAKHFPLE